ncbi:MAG: DUF418 domain-containing protein [Bacteroidales bacterium]|nr:DUF418 domain-containing protein [Bacteroidales bacterium]
MTRQLTSTQQENRIESLDILRGFALFGIALVNVLGFNASFFDFGGFYNNLSDPIQQKFYHTFIGLTADKFIFLYSFLFGYGFFLQFNKYGSQGSEFTSFYRRRLLFLALFGIAHIFFLWAGDILLLYAIGGSILFLLRKISGKVLLLIGLIFYFFISIWQVISIWIPLPDGLSSTCTNCLNDALQIYPTGTYLECLKLRLFEYYSFRNINILYYLSKVLGIFILGFSASKYKLHERINENRIKWVGIFLLIVCAGLLLYFYYERWVLKLIPADSNYMNAVYMGAYELMNLFVALSYIMLILLLASYKFNILKPFAYVGRMSLTNYIMQSVIFSIIFYGWGFGKFGMQEPTIFIWYAVGVFIFQLLFSYLWLKTKKQGPLEWIWRKLSYLN